MRRQQVPERFGDAHPGGICHQAHELEEKAGAHGRGQGCDVGTTGLRLIPDWRMSVPLSSKGQAKLSSPQMMNSVGALDHCHELIGSPRSAQVREVLDVAAPHQTLSGVPPRTRSCVLGGGSQGGDLLTYWGDVRGKRPPSTYMSAFWTQTPVLGRDKAPDP